jgi:hypothetical protein
MTRPRANCPNCGGPIEFLWSSAVQTTCPYCRSILVRHDVDLERVGEVADLPASMSPIQVGTEGVYRGRAFLVVGRIIYEYERGAWSEWHLVFTDGASGWLSDAQAEYAVSFLAPPSAPLPDADAMRRRLELDVGGTAYQVTSVTRARYRGVEGELPFEYWDKREVVFADLRAPGGGFATVDYSESPPLLFAGEYVEFDALALKNLRDPDAPGAPGDSGVRSRGFNCPNCGAAVALRAGALTQTVACASCLAVVDARDPQLRILQRFEQRTRVKPLIPLGSRGTLRGAEYDVIGFQIRTIVVDGTPYSWHEYLLFNPHQGFRYLSEYNGHWNDIVPLKTLPTQTSADGRKAMALHGETFRHFQTAEAKTTYVVGEFPWQVRVGDTATVSDYVAPPRLLSSEVTKDETSWSLGEYADGRRLWEAFKLPGAPPPPRGVFANQPSPFRGRAPAMWAAFGVLVVALVALAVARFVTAGNDDVFSRAYRWRPGDTTAFVTPTFELRGRTSNVVVAVESDVSNEWLFLSIALINEGTGVVREIGREVSYYSGRDADGAWHEGSTRDRATIAAVPSGRYFLRVQAEGAPPVASDFRAADDRAGTRAIDYRIRLARDVPSLLPFAVALLFLVVPPVLTTLRAAGFEQTRWQESDHASTTLSDLADAASDDD